MSRLIFLTWNVRKKSKSGRNVVREKRLLGEISFSLLQQLHSYLANIATCCKCHFTLIFTTSDNISEDGVFIMSPLGVNVISYWLLQLVTIFKKMLSLVVRFTISKVAKFHKNSQNNFQMSPHFVKSALNRECKDFTSSCHSWKFMTFTKCHHLL